MAGLRRPRRPVPQALRGPVLHRLRAVLHPGGATGRALSRSRHGAGPGSPKRTGSSACPATPASCAPSSATARSASSPPSAATRSWPSSTAACEDFSVSRSTRRARGWGIPVPGDPGQVIYVWFDALGNYLTALDYAKDSENLHRWWTGASQRIHLLGKGVLRFHAVYWPAMLLSAGQALPTDIAVHGYLTENGRKISKSSGATVDPYDLAARYGTDAVRWWLLREVPPRRGRRLHRAPPRRPRQRGTRQRLRQPGQPGRLPDPPLPRRPRPRRGSERTRRSSSREGRRERSPPDRRGTGGLRLPPRHRGGLAGRGRGKPLRQPRPPVGPGQSRRPRGTGRRPVSTPARLPGGRHAAGPVPPRRLGPHHPPVHPGRDRAAPAPGPAPAQDHPASPCTRARVTPASPARAQNTRTCKCHAGSSSGCPRRNL